MTWLNGVGVDPSDVAILVTGRGLSKMAGFPTGWKTDTSYHWPEQLWTELGSYYDAGSEVEPSRVHEPLPRADVITSSVDGLHIAAGCTDVIEISGSIRELVCPSCFNSTNITDVDELHLLASDEPDSCVECGDTPIPLLNVPGNVAFTRFLDERLDLAMERISRATRNDIIVFIAPDDDESMMAMIDTAARTPAHIIGYGTVLPSEHLFDTKILDLPLLF